MIYKVNHKVHVLKEMARDTKSKSRQHSKRSRRVKVGGAKITEGRSSEGSQEQNKNNLEYKKWLK